MLPIPLRAIFRNRWVALLWAAGIVWMAADYATPDAPSAGPAVVDNSEG